MGIENELFEERFEMAKETERAVYQWRVLFRFAADESESVRPHELMLSVVLPKTTQGCFLRKLKIFMIFKCINYFLFFLH